MDAISSHKHKRKRGITFVIVSRYRFRGNAVEHATVPTVLAQLLSPLPWYYRSGWFQYRRKSAITSVFPWLPRYSRHPHNRAALYYTNTTLYLSSKFMYKYEQYSV